ncbi:MAG: diguanylate cyclase [Clostridia bacterium]|nr:diguanylate cyclase [Clostridia bacterium]
MIYSVIGILAVLILLIENQDVLLNRNGAFDQPAWVVYRHFLYTVFAYYITDILWGIIESRKHSLLLFIDTSVYFVAMAVSVMFWTKFAVTYLDDRERFGRILLNFGRIFAVLVTALVIINTFKPILFVVDDACRYQELPLRTVILVVQILLLFMISIYTLVLYLSHKSEKRLKYRTLSLFGLVMAVFLVIQIWYAYWPLYAIAYMLGTCLLHTFIIGDEKEAFRRGLEEATKIAELKQSITSLLDNMPVLSFSKDVKTGAYLACNQAFAEYADVPSPVDVVGMTDFELFNRATAAHFVADDRKALEMDEPYIIYENVADALGNPRQFRTTKLNFYDANGKLCLLGMSVDVTEVEKIRHENELTKAAYQQALSESAVYENMINALSEEYFDLYYIDLATDEFIEYGSVTGGERRSTENKGTDFFNEARKDAHKVIYKEDRESFLKVLNKENILSEIKKNGVFITQYRLLIDGAPTYVSLKATCLNGDENRMIIGITNVDAQVRDHMAAQLASEERKTYLRLSALTGNLLVLYVVDPEDDRYSEYDTSTDFEKLGIEKHGEDFFEKSRSNGREAVYPEDMDLFLSLFTKENVLDTIRKDGVFVIDYRLLIGGSPTYVKLKAAMVEEDGKNSLIVGLMDVDAQVRQEQEFASSLSAARVRASKDALTGVKNKYAYGELEKKLNEQIANHDEVAFAVVVCDINDLKIVNDTQGHQAGDHYIREACTTICDVFKHSRVFRIGGDEFAVICQGRDYEHVDALLAQMDAANQTENSVKIACGMARYDGEPNVAAVFARADQLMYEHKARIKA